MPTDIQTDLTEFARILRKGLKSPVYKTSVIDYAVRLLASHEAKLDFMQVNSMTGESVRDAETGKRIWDMRKWDNWYYHRFLTDAAAETGAATGNQRLLDATRAKWATGQNMKPHYDTLADALILLRRLAKRMKGMMRK